jgi:hypothetical protein
MKRHWAKKTLLAAIVVVSSPRFAMAEAASCALIDQSGYQDLFSSVDALGRELQSAPGCSTNSDVKGMLSAQTQLQKSTEKLHAVAQDPAAAATMDPNALALQVNSALSSVNTIADSLRSNALLNSQCGKDMLSGGKVILALNDVISSLAPLALLAGTMTATLSTVIPYVVGVVGISSAVRILAKLSENGLDMSRPEHRQLVLRNTCEYSKVHKRIRYLQLVQTGQVEALQAELDANLAALGKSLESHPTLSKAVATHETQLKLFALAQKGLVTDRQALKDLQAQLESLNADEQFECQFGRALAGGDLNTFPFGVVTRLQLASQGAETVQTVAIVNTHLEFENSVRLQFRASPVQSLPSCAKLTKDWIKSLDRVMSATDLVVKSRQAQMQRELEKDPEYKTWHARMADVERERKIVGQIIEFMKSQSAENAAINRSELHQRIRDVRSALFGSPRALNFGSSPVMSWLSHSVALHEQSLASFKSGVDRLAADYLKLMYLNARDKQAQSVSYRNATQLGFLVPADFAVGSVGWRNVCGRLESIMMDWLRARDHLEATELFCQAIQPLLADDVESGILSICLGERDLTGRVVRSPRIQQLHTASDTHIKALALIVQQRRSALQCPGPEMYRYP